MRKESIETLIFTRWKEDKRGTGKRTSNQRTNAKKRKRNHKRRKYD